MTLFRLATRANSTSPAAIRVGRSITNEPHLARNPGNRPQSRSSAAISESPPATRPIPAFEQPFADPGDDVTRLQKSWPPVTVYALGISRPWGLGRPPSRRTPSSIAQPPTSSGASLIIDVPPARSWAMRCQAVEFRTLPDSTNCWLPRSTQGVLRFKPFQWGKGVLAP